MMIDNRTASAIDLALQPPPHQWATCMPLNVTDV